MNDVDRRLEEVSAKLVALISEPDTWEKVEMLDTLLAQLRSIMREIKESLPDDTEHTQAGW